MEIIIAIIGVFTTLSGSWAAWFFTRKKYNAEVDSSELDNLQKQIEIYKGLIEDYKNKLDEYISLSEENRTDILKLQKTVTKLLSYACKKKVCTKREFFSDEDIEALSHGEHANTILGNGTNS